MDKKKICVFCKKEFEELSEEHIIPNVLCGRLKSKNLICKNCNSWLGENIDSAFDGVYSQITHLFKIKRERGNGQPFIATDAKNNTKYRILNDGTYELANVACQTCKSDKNGFELRFEAPIDKKRLKNAIGKELAAKKEELSKLGLDYKKTIKDAQENIDKNWNIISTNTLEFKPDRLSFQGVYGGKNVALGILKIAYLFFKEIKPDIEIDDDAIIDLLKNKSESIFDKCLFYNLETPLFEEISDGISHFIYVEGGYGKIIAYIKLFSITPYVCILKENYYGADFNFSYGYNLLNGVSFTPHCHIITNLNNLKQDLEYQQNFEQASKNLQIDISRIMNLYYKLNPIKREIQIEVEKYIKEQLGCEVVNTPLFQSIIDLLGKFSCEFGNEITEQEKTFAISRIADVIFEYIKHDFSRYVQKSSK